MNNYEYTQNKIEPQGEVPKYIIDYLKLWFTNFDEIEGTCFLIHPEQRDEISSYLAENGLALKENSNNTNWYFLTAVNEKTVPRKIDIADKILSIREQMNDILERLVGSDFTISLDYHEYHPAGANFYGVAQFRARIKDVKFKDMDFDYWPASMTAKNFVNGIKAYMLDVLDGVVNVL